MAIKKIIKKYKIIVDIVKIYVILKLTKRKIERKKNNENTNFKYSN